VCDLETSRMGAPYIYIYIYIYIYVYYISSLRVNSAILTQFFSSLEAAGRNSAPCLQLRVKFVLVSPYYHQRERLL